uniref:phenylalanine--tRNA ligase n=1 Tax=Polysiphonia sp. TaxID=1967842 RepID=A0A1Z1MTL1_9FLOR|nr:Phenylalanine-tRNA ligase beta subunit [Polysiphonia sp.]
MKFSWRLISNFICIKSITLNDFQNVLTLSGLEIEDVQEIKTNKDKIIDLSITANRKEICSVLNLALETSIIFNTKLKIIPIKFKYNNDSQYIKNHSSNNENQYISYIRIINIGKIHKIHTPEWLLYHIKINGLIKDNLLANIQEYIRIKWGQTFIIINTQKIKEKKNLNIYHNGVQIFNIEENFKNFKDKIVHSNKENLIIFATIQSTNNTHTIKQNLDEFYENMYLDSIRLIHTITKNKIGKSKEIYKTILVKQNIIKIKQKTINSLLGYTDIKKFKFITKNTIYKILEQLKLQPKYESKEKAFIVKVPNYRKHDLIREIDIIEEIGKIYKFENLLSETKINKRRGCKSQYFIEVKKIRKVLRNLGLHEVVNCCLTKNINTQTQNVNIYNPITKEQKELRKNILESLIDNYLSNIKHTHQNIEIFEIGKTFTVDKENKKRYEEKIHIGGLLYNKQYIRKNWSEKSSEFNLFHFKNLVETFLESINSKSTMEEIKYINPTYNIKHLFKKNRKIGIYRKENNKLVGIIGELDNHFIKLTNEKQEKIYGFEFDLNELLNTMQYTNHLDYINKKYSNYPSITRDISIQLNQHVNVKQIKDFILKNINVPIESIEIFNEYQNKSNRFVGIRITYRSYTKTLNNNDVRIIHDKLQNKLKQFNKIQLSIMGKT